MLNHIVRMQYTDKHTMLANRFYVLRTECSAEALVVQVPNGKLMICRSQQSQITFISALIAVGTDLVQFCYRLSISFWFQQIENISKRIYSF